MDLGFFPYEYEARPNVVIERNNLTNEIIQYRVDMLDKLCLECLTTPKLMELYNILSDELERRARG